MKRSSIRTALWIIIVVLLVTVVALFITGCTWREEANAKAVGGAVATVLGLPPVVGESLVGAALIASHALSAKLGHSSGRKRERAEIAPKAAT